MIGLLSPRSDSIGIFYRKYSLYRLSGINPLFADCCVSPHSYVKYSNCCLPQNAKKTPKRGLLVEGFPAEWVRVLFLHLVDGLFPTNLSTLSAPCSRQGILLREGAQLGLRLMMSWSFIRRWTLARVRSLVFFVLLVLQGVEAGCHWVVTFGFELTPFPLVDRGFPDYGRSP